ncbi:MAG: 50S ribosomal protein L4 [Nanoarchaeota archaeon]|nr:50S ribosomal protein L4 [Nanoarchaeota archaeon]
MKADVFNAKGEKTGKVDLPKQFSEAYRPIIITRAFNANISNNYQHHGTDPEAGMRKVTELSKRRRKYRGVYGAGRSRVPKKIISRRGTHFNFVGEKAPHTRKGRIAHPPKTAVIFEEKINTKERLLAIRSAISATTNKDLVIERNHSIENVSIPLVIEKAQDLKKTNDVKKLLEKIGLKEELERVSEKKIRAGKGKMRGRKYKTKKGPLFVVEKDCSLLKAAKGLQGVETIPVKNLNVTILAPGGVPGRLTVWTSEALNLMNEEKLFTGEKK